MLRTANALKNAVLVVIILAAFHALLPARDRPRRAVRERQFPATGGAVAWQPQEQAPRSVRGNPEQAPGPADEERADAEELRLFVMGLGEDGPGGAERPRVNGSFEDISCGFAQPFN